MNGINTNAALAQIRQGLIRLGFRETKPEHWEFAVPGARLTVTRREFGNPYYRCEWCDSRHRDVMFLDFGLTAARDLNGVNSLLAWAGWYAAGNRMADGRTIGFDSGEQAAAA